jgi:hypothetical protein
MFHWLEKLIPVFVESVLKTPGNPPLGGSLHFFFYDAIKILILVSLMIFAISYLRSWFQPQKTKEMLTQVKGVKANFAASRLGIGIGAVIRGWAPADF